MKRFSWVLFAAFAACPSTPSLPGNEAMGIFELHAEPLSIDCPLGALPDGGFDFEVTARHDKGQSGAYLLISGVAGDAGFDGQYVTSVRSAPRSFDMLDGGTCTLTLEDGGPGDCASTLTETFVFALLSQEEDMAAGGQCPTNPLDGGVEALDAGAPHSTDTGYDALRVCGVLTDAATISGECSSECLVPCTLSYTVTGTRK